jgi:hypothetical protein
MPTTSAHRGLIGDVDEWLPVVRAVNAALPARASALDGPPPLPRNASRFVHMLKV